MNRAPLLFLIGYRGTGKTTVARLVAARLHWHWLDADALLEERAGRTIRQIFAEEGEKSFRDRESAVLQDVCRDARRVVATGGGVILRAENRALLKSGAVVWLKAPAAVLWERLRQDDSTAERRPNLAQGGLAEIEELLRVRTPLYEACQDFSVDTSEQTPDQVADAISAWFHHEAPKPGQ